MTDLIVPQGDIPEGLFLKGGASLPDPEQAELLAATLEALAAVDEPSMTDEQADKLLAKITDAIAAGDHSVDLAAAGQELYDAGRITDLELAVARGWKS